MPRYKVIAPGFHDGRLYDPNGKRPFLDVDKPFNKKNKPSWVAEMKKESDAAKKKREDQEAAQQKAADDKAEQDGKDIAEASFLGEGEKADDVIETV